MIGCMVIMVVMNCSLASLNHNNLGMGIAFTIIGPFALGIIELVALSMAPLFCKAVDIGLATGLLLSIRSAGGSVSIAVYTTILRNRLASIVPEVVGPAATKAGLPLNQVDALSVAVESGTWAKFPGLNPAITTAVQQAIPLAYMQAFKTVYLAAIGFGVAGIVGSLLTKDVRKHLTDKVERKMNTTKEMRKDHARHVAEEA